MLPDTPVGVLLDPGLSGLRGTVPGGVRGLQIRSEVDVSLRERNLDPGVTEGLVDPSVEAVDGLRALHGGVHPAEEFVLEGGIAELPEPHPWFRRVEREFLREGDLDEQDARAAPEALHLALDTKEIVDVYEQYFAGELDMSNKT
jgi:hypothetical protein